MSVVIDVSIILAAVISSEVSHDVANHALVHGHLVARH